MVARYLTILLTGFCTALAAGAGDTGLVKRVLAEFASDAEYNRQLCAMAQRMIINADSDEFADAFSIVLERAPGGSFKNEQMDIDADARAINVAMTTVTVQVDGVSESIATHVACKMVNRARVNDVLQLDLSGPAGSCRRVNERTYRIALNMLSPKERNRYESTGRQLRFVDDYVADAGGEWLPSVMNDFMRSVDDENAPGYIEIQAPSVQVPWDPVSRDWFKGTHHCKLITLTAMRRWMTGGALTGATEMFPRSRPACEAPSSQVSTVGSCVFYFGPAESMFCQDYTGPGWTAEQAREECGIRHATESAWIELEKRYAGTGGIYSESNCAARHAGAGFQGTCVFHCNAPDESLWHVMSTKSPDGRVPGMDRACDLFMPAKNLGE